MDPTPEYLAKLDAGIARLPAKQRAVLLMCAREKLAYAEIGKRLGISERRVEKLLAKAIYRLDRYVDLGW